MSLQVRNLCRTYARGDEKSGFFARTYAGRGEKPGFFVDLSTANPRFFRETLVFA
ncbi:hypothetical protein [Microseira wollei]|uniref:hypothetical protein n=1 Tax=Microseira wollei TaxID=467598 RepID=UPI001CFC6499|nr:hypothetical protein [Microseira wollei]